MAPFNQDRRDWPRGYDEEGYPFRDDEGRYYRNPYEHRRLMEADRANDPYASGSRSPEYDRFTRRDRNGPQEHYGSYDEPAPVHRSLPLGLSTRNPLGLTIFDVC